MKKMIAAWCIIAALLGQAGASYALPANEFTCKVQTISDQIGVVMVQADDLPGAQSTALEVEARQLDGEMEQVKTVLECIRYPEDRFVDYKFQAFVDAIPR